MLSFYPLIGEKKMARNYKTYKTSKNVTRKTFREDDALYAIKFPIWPTKYSVRIISNFPFAQMQ